MPLPKATARRDAKQEEREQQRYEEWLADEYAEIAAQEPFPLPAKCPCCGGLLPHIGGRCNSPISPPPSPTLAKKFGS